MQIRDINKPITSKTLNETLAKQYGTRLDTDSFTLEQLQDARNKVRSKVFDIETNESYGGVDSNETYGKNKLFLDVLNAAILERDDIQDHPIEEAQSAAQKAAFQKMLDKKSGKDQKTKPEDKATKADSKPKDGKMPMDDNGTPGDKSDDKPAFLKKKNESKHIDEGKDIINNYFTSLLKEGAEDHAELIMAAKDMVDRLTGWMEDTAEMQTESMLELADSIRDEMGSEKSEAFTALVKPSLEALYTSLEGTREALTGGVTLLTGEGDMPTPMGTDDEMGDEVDPEAPVDADVDVDGELDVDGDVADDFGADEVAAGGEEEAGRAKRESVERSRKLGTILSKKKS